MGRDLVRLTFVFTDDKRSPPALSYEPDPDKEVIIMTKSISKFVFNKYKAAKYTSLYQLEIFGDEKLCQISGMENATVHESSSLEMEK